MNDYLGTKEHDLQSPDQRFQTAKRIRLDAITNAWTIDLAANEPRLLQHLEVLRHGGLRKRQFVDDVTADARSPANEEPQDLDPGGVSEGFRERRQLFVRLRPLDRS